MAHNHMRVGKSWYENSFCITDLFDVNQNSGGEHSMIVGRLHMAVWPYFLQGLKGGR